MSSIRYSLGIEIDHTPQGFFLFKKTYISDLLDDYYMKENKPFRLPMDSHLECTITTGVPLRNSEPYQKLVGKLIYLSITSPEIVCIHSAYPQQIPGQAISDSCR
ncbi:unnamed protein product [Amaranthus hypochondriacus]